MTGTTPIIIDCDPGVDDSYAIAMAHAHPGFDIVAITAVEGNVPARLTRHNALCLADTLGIDCRVAFGAEKPLRKAYDRDASSIHGASGVGDVVFDPPSIEPDPKPAWDVIYEEAVKAEGRLILFATGPLTNIALTLQHHPDLPKYINRFCIMGGGTFGNITKFAEFNVFIDPTAAREVFAQLPVEMIGLNITHAAALTEADFQEMLAIGGDLRPSKMLHELATFSERQSHLPGSDNSVIHDAVAVASVINPDLIEYDERYVYVEDGDNAENSGQTVIEPEDDPREPKCKVGMKVDRDAFTAMLKGVFHHYAE